MEQARYFVLAKRGREIVEESSWEEKAFAQDAAGMLGGCVWPPRSYTCSFCRREFRSAQALGGHMNVHRRDRAKLKQFSTPTNNQNILNNPRLTDCYLDQNTCSYTQLLTDNKNPRKKNSCCFDFQNPNPDLHLSVVNSVHQEVFVPTTHFLPSFEMSPENNPFLTLTANDSEKNEKSSLPMILVFADNDHDQSIVDVEDDDADAPKRRKRRKYDDEELILEVHDLKSCAVQELDLELRLGDPPKTC